MQNERRLIDAYKLEDLVRSNSARYHCADDVIAAIAGQPTVDAVEVVRCEDCRFFEQVEYYTGDAENPGFKNVCRLLKRQMQRDDFCSYGERKDNG